MVITSYQRRDSCDLKRERIDGNRRSHLSILSRSSQTERIQFNRGATVSMSGVIVSSNLPTGLCLSRLYARRQVDDHRDDHEREWHSGYWPRPSDQPCDCDRHAQKNAASLTQVNPHLLAAVLDGERTLEVDITCEMDEQWSFVQRKRQQRWLWHAWDRRTKTVIAYVLGPHTDAVFKELLALLRPFRIAHYYTDGWASYAKYLPPGQHTISKQGTQRIERIHLDFRTRIKRLARKTICFSKSCELHDLVIGLFINRYEFREKRQI